MPPAKTAPAVDVTGTRGVGLSISGLPEIQPPAAVRAVREGWRRSASVRRWRWFLLLRPTRQRRVRRDPTRSIISIMVRSPKNGGHCRTGAGATSVVLSVGPSVVIELRHQRPGHDPKATANQRKKRPGERTFLTTNPASPSQSGAA